VLEMGYLQIATTGDSMLEGGGKDRFGNLSLRGEGERSSDTGDLCCPNEVFRLKSGYCWIRYSLLYITHLKRKRIQTGKLRINLLSNW
jgi:hypothetical protein